MFCCVLDLNNYFKLNEIHMIESPFNEFPKNIILSKEALISGEGWLENLGKMGNFMDIYCFANRGDQFRKRISAATSWNPYDASIFLHARPNFSKKIIFRPKFDLSWRFISSQNIRTYSQNFYMTTCLSLKTMNS